MKNNILTIPLADLKRIYARSEFTIPDQPTFRENSRWDRFLEVMGDLTPDKAEFAPVQLTTIDRTPPAPLLLGRLDPAEHTILYGPGGIGKGSLAAWWIVLLTKLGRTVLILDYESHGPEWARRIFGLGGQEALEAVGYAAPLASGLGPIWEHADTIRENMIAQEAPYIVIDSATMACAGHDPSEPETPSLYFGALQRIGIPNLTLAHVTKLHDVRYPFGSVFWHNLARMTWSMMPKGEDTLLSCQKANNYLRPPAATITMTWLDGKLGEVRETRASVTLLERILDTLTDGPLTVAAIAEALNEGLPKDEHTGSETIRKTLNRDLVHGATARVTKVGDQWATRPDEA